MNKCHTNVALPVSSFLVILFLGLVLLDELLVGGNLLLCLLFLLIPALRNYDRLDRIKILRVVYGDLSTVTENVTF